MKTTILVLAAAWLAAGPLWAQAEASVEDADLLALEGTTLRGVMLRNPFLAVELTKSLGDRPAGGGTT